MDATRGASAQQVEVAIPNVTGAIPQTMSRPSQVRITRVSAGVPWWVKNGWRGRHSECGGQAGARLSALGHYGSESHGYVAFDDHDDGRIWPTRTLTTA